MSMNTVNTTIRSAIGISSWTVPILAARLVGVDISNDQSGKFFMKLAGTRDIALAIAGAATNGESRRQVLRATAACDVADVVAALITRKQGNITSGGAALWIIGALACLAITLRALGETRADDPIQTHG